MTFIVNPASGRGKTKGRMNELLDGIAEVLGPTSSPTIESTTARGDATQLAEKAIENGAEAVIAVGGDGTVNEVLQAVFGSGRHMGIVPFGTGNDLSRELGFGTDWKKALGAIRDHNVREIDVAQMTCMSTGESRYFANIVGCGFDAAVAIEVNSGVKFVGGTAAYIVGILKCLSRLKPVPITLTIDGETIESQALLCAIANSTSYGGGMKVAPLALLDDGLLDIVLVEKTSKLDFMVTFPRVFKGTHLSHKRVRHFQAAKITLTTPTPSPALIDGEIFGTTPLEFKVFPKSLKMYCAPELCR